MERRDRGLMCAVTSALWFTAITACSASPEFSHVPEMPADIDVGVHLGQATFAVLEAPSDDVPPPQVVVASAGEAGPTVVGFFDGGSSSRSVSVVLRSAAAQFPAAAFVAVDISGDDLSSQLNRVSDWDLDELDVVAAATSNEAIVAPVTVLIDADGTVVARWDGIVLASDLAASLANR